jgi:hypothetical protein
MSLYYESSLLDVFSLRVLEKTLYYAIQVLPLPHFCLALLCAYPLPATLSVFYLSVSCYVRQAHASTVSIHFHICAAVPADPHPH